MIFAAGALHYINMLEVVRHSWFTSVVSGFGNGLRLAKSAWAYYQTITAS